MINLTTAQLAAILNAKLQGASEVSVSAINTDTRKFVADSLFFALKGEHFDAHQYVAQAKEMGAVALVVEREVESDLPQLIVENTRLALGDLAKWLRTQLAIPTIALTGSSGKTSVKEMTAAILQAMTKTPEAVLFTEGNLNNDLGVPFTLLRLTPEHQFAVIELGANHIGEIAYTAAIAQPDVALVNNVAPAHLEGFGSLEGVKQAKGEIYQGLKANGIAVVNCAHDYPEWQNALADKQVCRFGFNQPEADYWADEIELHSAGARFQLHTPKGAVRIDSPYLGEHNISNALAAASLAMAVGADLNAVQQGLAHRTSVKGRLFPIALNDRVTLIDDTYNANVDSLKSAIAVLVQQAGFRILAVGDMAELGAESAACHQQVADAAQAAGLDLIVSFGEQSAVISANPAHHFRDKAAMSAFLAEVIRTQSASQQVTLLAKGSRSQRMEELLTQLITQLS